MVFQLEFFRPRSYFNKKKLIIYSDGSQHISHALEQSTPLAQSTPLRPATHATTSHASNLTPIADYNDDVADELFDQDGAAVSTSFREGLVGIQTNMDPNVSQHLLRIGVSLDRDEVDRIQPVQPNPNEIRPIRRVSSFNFFLILI